MLSKNQFLFSKHNKTIINVTVAHCFAYLDGTAKDKEIFTVRVGKHYREPTLIEAPTQERKVNCYWFEK